MDIKRYSSIDAFRGIFALFVIFIHTPIPGALGGALMPLMRIAVPFFFMVSGFFLWDNYDNVLLLKIKSQIKKIFKLVILSNVAFFLWELMTRIINNYNIFRYFIDTFTIKNLIKFLLLNESPFAGHLWFLSALLYVLIIDYLGVKYKIRKKILIIVPFLLLVDLLLGKYSILILNKEFPYILVRNFLFVGIPYFYIGNFIRDKLVKNSLNKINNKFILIACIIFSITSILEKLVLIINNKNAVRDHYLSTTFLTLSIFIYLKKNINYLRIHLWN
jgi:peptidoglycan/LPS O-acetylase OafA/YrhL